MSIWDVHAPECSDASDSLASLADCLMTVFVALKTCPIILELAS